MAYTTIKKPSLHFNTKLYSGTGSAQNITGVGFQPDWCWFKNRSAANDPLLYDAVRGVSGKDIRSSATDGSGTDAQGLTAFGSDGFSIGTKVHINGNGNNIVCWNWKANGAGSANTAGSINTTATSVNTTAGFSICKWTGSGANATIGHGLGAVPKMIMVKNLDATENWVVYHGSNTSAPETDYLMLNSTNASADGNTVWNDTAPTSSVFTVSTSAAVNGNGNNMIAYCFAEKIGYSKFGSYTGNGNADGPFIYTGFKPAWFMCKKSSASGNNWTIWDNKRDPKNPMDLLLHPNSSNAENDSGDDIDFCSNGVKFRNSAGGNNASSATYIYMAFAEEPLVGDNPATAR